MSNENSKMKAMSEAKCIKIDKCFTRYQSSSYDVWWVINGKY